MTKSKAAQGLTLEVAAIGGPCIAGELAVRRQTGVVITSQRDMSFAQRLCEHACYRLLPSAPSSDDIHGVEICAAFKNFFAIAVG